MALNTTATYTPVINEQAYKTMLAAINPGLIHALPCETFKMMLRHGDTVIFSRPGDLDTFEVPLPRDGSWGAGQLLTRTDIKATVQPYGTHVALMDETVMYNFEDVIQVAANALGIALRKTEDLLIRKAMEATTSVVNAVGGNNGDLPTNLSATDVSDVTAQLAGNSAYMVFNTVGATDKIGTGPVPYCYIALCHTDLIRDLEAIPNFQPRHDYSTDSLIPEEIGALGKVRFFASPRGSIDRAASGAGRDVYNIFIVGLQSVGIVEQDSYSSEIIYTAPQDPYKRVATLAVISRMVPLILHDPWVFKVRVTRRA